MSLTAVTKDVREFGLQTHSRAMRMPPQLRDAELEYLDIRDWFSFELSRLAQFQEALEQAKTDGNDADADMFSKKIHGIQAGLVDARERVRTAAMRSYAETVVFVAKRMLPKEVWLAIEDEVRRLIGRGPVEIRGSRDEAKRRRNRKAKY